jgi:parallel beta-helix repeat protein
MKPFAAINRACALTISNFGVPLIKVVERIGSRFLVSCLSVLALLLSIAPEGHAQSCGETVSGHVTLTSNLTCATGHGLLLDDGATLNCAGFRIVGSDVPGQYGIYLRSVGGATVENCTVEHFEVGIRLRTASHCVVQNSIVQHNTVYGIEVTQSSTLAVIQGNTIHNNSDEGIHVSGPTDRDAGHHIVGNLVTNNALEGIYLFNSNANIIESNTMRGQGTAGIYLASSDRNTITGNTLTNDAIQFAAGSQFNTLTDNTITGQRIKFDASSNNTVYAMTVQGQAGTPSNAYDFNASSNNQIFDSAARNPGDFHVRAAMQSKSNAFIRFTAVPSPLRCFVDKTSSVTVNGPSGTQLKCGK